MPRETHFIGARALQAGEKADDAPHGWVEGIANAYEVDRYGDLILPSAFAASFPKFLTNPVMTFGHGMDGNPTDGTLPAGTILKLTQDEKGNTCFRARFAGTEDAQKVRQLYVEGDMRAFSVHFLPYGDSFKSRQPTAEEMLQFPTVQRVITDLELIEIACAVVPVNAGSLVSGAKSLNGGQLEQPPILKTTGARAMGKSILTTEHRKAIDTARKAYDAHAKSLKDMAGSLDELAESGKGEEADHGAMCAKCVKAFTTSADTHAKLGEAVKSMHKAITNTDADGGDTNSGDDPDHSDTGDGGSDPVDDADAKAFVERFTKNLAKA